MAMSKNLKKQWRVQTKSAKGTWVNRGLFETRSAARRRCSELRGAWSQADGVVTTSSGYGFGNTRVVPYVKGGAK